MSDKELILKYVPKEDQDQALKKLESGYPVQYIIGNVEFYHMIFDINEDVLIPRFETEFLVDILIKKLKQSSLHDLRAIDIGTGSGVIAISLAKNINLEIDAIDISAGAIKVAKHNAEKNNANVNFIKEDIAKYTPLKKYNLIVSNPPYVRFDEIIDSKIKYEPSNAIFANENGLYFYKLILSKSKSWLDDKFIIAFEIGKDQAKNIIDYAREIYPSSKIECLKDLNGFDRYIFIINE